MKLTLITTMMLWGTSAQTNPLQGCSLELAFLIDASSGFAARQSIIASGLESAFGELESMAYSFRAAIATFVDKPAPELGVGDFGGNLVDTAYYADWCWELAQPFATNLTSQVSSIVNGLTYGSGLDEAEGHFEAVAHALLDGSLDWSDGTRRMIVLITDGTPHVNEEGLSAADAINRFNAPLQCAADGTTTGGFGSTELPDTLSSLDSWTPKADVYSEYASLSAKQVCGTITDSEAERLAEITPSLEKVTWPTTKDFDAEVLKSDPATHCAEHEYPSYTQLTEWFLDTNTELLVIAIDETSKFKSDTEISPMYAVQTEWNLIMNTKLRSIPMAVAWAAESKLPQRLGPMIVQYVQQKFDSSSVCGA